MTDPRIKRPCPFCGEALHLIFQTDATHFPMIEGNDTVKDENGYDLENPVDAVSCSVCCAHVPAVVWNGDVSASEFAIRRAFEVENGKCGCGHEHYASSAVLEAA
ncbi:hypothetical protein [Caulobacter sp. SSI4214]|uniref:hypothetical protein n=1 Tax=Caulobacter sp. SSI4214 TaxID=2575739 RepID=UPI00143C71CC|nr:hypothetical protein [Caulobacter sp. SSI4214]